MASAEAEIRHVFGATCLTEGSIGAAPPDIVKLSGWTIRYPGRGGGVSDPKKYSCKKLN